MKLYPRYLKNESLQKRYGKKKKIINQQKIMNPFATFLEF